MTRLFYLAFADPDSFAQLREPSGLAAGDEDLAGDDLVQDEVLPAGIQLGKDIVQKEHRLLAEFPRHQLPLGQLQADRGGAGLALGAVGLQVDPRKAHGEVILVRARQALARLQLRPFVPLQVLVQQPGQLLHRGEGVRDIGNGLILEVEFLRAAGELAVEPGGFLAQALIEPGPLVDH